MKTLFTAFALAVAGPAWAQSAPSEATVEAPSELARFGD